MALRPYQETLKGEVEQAWNQNAKNVLMRLDTGGGKTHIIADIHREHNGATAAIAHRSELVGQLSLSLARQGVRHDLIAAETTRRGIAADHIDELGRSFYDPSSRHVCASVDTLVKVDNRDAWFSQVTHWTTDEGHHVIRGNKWDTALNRFTNSNCRGLLPTATPRRADGKGLGRHADGIADVMVQGPPMRWLIDQDYLSDYTVYCPPSDLLQMLDQVGPTGDWTAAQLKQAAHKSQIVGDAVKSYLMFARGKRGVTFATDIDTAADMVLAYQAAGVRAELITGKTDPGYRRQTLRRFAAGGLDMLVAVDIISEGFDLPAIEVGIFARPTESLALYMQQFGRTLRILAGKMRAIIIDLAGNVVRHLAPDRIRPWSLDRAERKGAGGGGIPLRICLGCYQPFERFRTKCPHCGKPIPEPEPGGRSVLQVDGDLMELDAETLAKLRGEVEDVDQHHDYVRRDMAARNVPQIGQMAAVNRHVATQVAQRGLRELMGAWGWIRRERGLTDREMQREFFLTFGCSVLEAMALGKDNAEQLRQRISGQL